jgi:hypothetical protein
MANALMIAVELLFKLPEGAAAIFFWSNRAAWARLNRRSLMTKILAAS